MSTAYSAASVIIPAQGGGGKAGTLYGWKPDVNQLQDIDVLRNTTASRVNEAGLIEFVGVNVPRFDWGEGGSCPKLLVEPERMNLVTYSEEFDNAAWSKNNTTITANAITAPDGTLSADEIFFTATNGEHTLTQPTFISNGTRLTQSYFVKNNNQDFIQIYTAGAPLNLTAYVNFNLSSGVISQTSGSISGKIESYDNQWYKISVTATAIATGNASLGIISIPTSTSGLRPSYTAGGESIYIWGAQLEEGSHPTSYIKTEASQETRNADVISKTGISSLIGQSEGTIFFDFEYKQPSPDLNGRLLQLYETNDATNSILPLIFGDGPNVNQFQLTVFSAAVGITAILADASTLVPFGRQKFAIAYDSGAYTVYRNGLLFASASGLTPASLDSMSLGSSSFAARSLGNPINQAALYKTRLTNDELADLTTL